VTRCSIKVFVEFHERNGRARLGFVPGYRDSNSRVHILVSAGAIVGRTLCNLGQQGTPFESALLGNPALPCAQCFDKARALVFRYQRKAEEQPGRL
jgi:hypothetical protein